MKITERTSRHVYEREVAPRSLARTFWQKSLHILARFCIPPGLRLTLYRMMGVSIGRHVFVGLDTWLDDQFPELIHIEDGAVLSFRVTVVVHDDARHVEGTWAGVADGTVAPVVFRKGCYIGAGSMVLPGVTVGEGSVVGAGSVVTRDVAPGTVVVGVPARVMNDVV